jgi:hypothetical protein
MNLEAGLSHRSDGPIPIERVNCGIAYKDSLSCILAECVTRVPTKIVEQAARDVNVIAARSKTDGYCSHI